MSEPETVSQVVSVPSNFPVPSPMGCKGDRAENWKFFRSQWEDFETATELNKKSAAIRIATLRSVMGKDCLRIYHHLDISAEDKQDVKKSLDALESHFKPTKNVIYDRYVFNTCTQEPAEGIDQYMTRLRQLASSCDYGNLTDDMLRDRLILGTKDSAARARMFRETDLTLARAIDMCRIAEISQHQLLQIGSKQEEVNFTKQHKQQSRKQQRWSQQRSQHKRCKYCGQSHTYDKSKCPAFGKLCKACGKRNHFATVCKQKHRVEKAVHRIDQDSDDSSIFHTNQFVGAVKTRGKQLTVPLKFWKTKDSVSNNRSKCLVCQLDTGATCNVLNIEDYKAVTGESDTNLKESSVRLNFYDGSWMKPLGYATLHTRINGKNFKFGFQIVNTRVAQKPLLSANTCQRLNLLSINSDEVVHMSQEVTTGLSKEDILGRFSDVFQGLGQFPGEHHIELDETITPVQHQPRRVPVALRAELKEKIDSMVAQRILKKVVEPTPWINSMVVVRKPGKLRLCIGPVDLNKVVKRPKYQMPTIEEILPNLENAKVFSVLDAKDGFCHIKLDKESSMLTTFWTPFGRYRWLRLPFGLTSAPEVFQCKQHEVLEGLHGVEVIADDILVYGCGKTQEEAVKDHDANLIELLKRAQKVNLKLNKKKLKLKMTEVSYMGHLLTSTGLKPDPEKIKAVTEMKRPSNVKETQCFLGFVNYLAKFAPHLSDVSEPLRRLTDKDTVWVWQTQQEEAFRRVKEIVTVQPVLKYYSLSEPVTLQSDASQKGLGATLLQNGQPIAFASRSLSKTEQSYAQIEKECLAIVFGCERFKQYLLGRDSIQVESDHKPLEVIFKKSLLSAPKRLQRMLLRLQKYNLQVKYKRGSVMYIADLLSRASISAAVPSTSDFEVFCTELEQISYTEHLKVSDTRLDQIQMSTLQDSTLQSLKSTILAGWPNDKNEIPACLREYWPYREELSVQNGILFKGNQILIPKAMIPEMLSRIHSSHLGMAACTRKAKDVLYWPHMATDIKELISKCETCVEVEENRRKEPLMTHEIPDRAWSKLALDLFCLQDKHYLVTVDYYSDYWEVDSLHSTSTAAVIKKLKPHFARWGIPNEVVTDNGPQFVSDEFARFAKEWNFRHITSSPYHSQSNGKAESAVKIVKNLLKKTQRAGGDFFKAQLDWRNTPTSEMQSSPVQCLISRRTRTFLPTSENLLQPQVVENVQEKIKLKCQKAKLFHDKHAHQLPELEIGQPVYVKPLPNSAGPWKKGVCTDKLSPRSYAVTVDDKSYRRNRFHLREREKEVKEVVHPQTTDKQSTVTIEATQSDSGSDIASVPTSSPSKTTEIRRSGRNKKTTEHYQAGFN